MASRFYGSVGFIFCATLSFGSHPRSRLPVPTRTDYSNVLQSLREWVPCFKRRLFLAKVSPDKFYCNDFWNQEDYVYAPLLRAESFLKSIRRRDENAYNNLAAAVKIMLNDKGPLLFRQSLKNHFFKSAQFIITYGGELASIDHDVAEVLDHIVNLSPHQDDLQSRLQYMYSLDRDDFRCRLQHLYLLGDIVRTSLARIDLDTELKKRLRRKEDVIQRNICFFEVDLEAYSLLTKIQSHAQENELSSYKKNIDNVIMKHDPVFHFFDTRLLGAYSTDGQRTLFDQALQRGLTHTVLWLLAKKTYPIISRSHIETVDSLRGKILTSENLYLCEKEDELSMLRMILSVMEQENFLTSERKLLDNTAEIVSEIRDLLIEKKERYEQTLNEDDVWTTYCTRGNLHYLSQIINARKEGPLPLMELCNLGYIYQQVYAMTEYLKKRLRHPQLSLQQLKMTEQNVTNLSVLLDVCTHLIHPELTDESLLRLHFLCNKINEDLEDLAVLQQKLQNKSPSRMTSSERVELAFFLLSSGYCPSEDVKKCLILFPYLTSDEINNTELWRETPFLVRLFSLPVDEPQQLRSLVKLVLKKDNLEISLFLVPSGDEITYSPQYIHDEEIGKELLYYHDVQQLL